MVKNIKLLKYLKNATYCTFKKKKYFLFKVIYKYFDSLLNNNLQYKSKTFSNKWLSTFKTFVLTDLHLFQNLFSCIFF